ncbi:DUF2264 domain-containing protein [Oscillospiraceae bacterium HV4-5-C5C]|nr:DUF2264 domain-containing protein [Oscillospiraceae bacterium HV4-5-C5C]
MTDNLSSQTSADPAAEPAARPAARPAAPLVGTDPVELRRQFWFSKLQRIVRPVLALAAAGKLPQAFPRDLHPDRAAFAPLEALARSLTGLAPWLDLASDHLSAAEASAQADLRQLAQAALRQSLAPEGPGRLIFDGSQGPQTLVDSGFLAHAILRAPQTLNQQLDPETRRALAQALRASREILPYRCNWILFSAMVEAALAALGQDWDRVRVEYAIRQTLDWYAGDGLYGDGPAFHADYYNSFVIQPMLLDILTVFQNESDYASLRPAVKARATRAAALLERLVMPDGSYPVLGRSQAYRFGSFHLLSQSCLQHFLPAELPAAQVRCALSAVLTRTFASPVMFDEAGWLLPGISGLQPGLCEPYINRGSLYLCSTVFLPLGLPPQDPFWAEADCAWTQCRVWAAEDLPCDRALADQS